MPAELACNQVIKIMNDMLAQIEWILQEILHHVSPTGMVRYPVTGWLEIIIFTCSRLYITYDILSF
jgi:hypothetical protein